MRALTCAAVLLALARCSVDGNATTLEESPELVIVRPDQSPAVTPKLFPGDHGTPTHWIVTTAHGRAMTVLLLAQTQGDPRVGGKGTLPQWSEAGVTSDARRAIARFLVEGGTVGMTSQPPRGARRCRPERDVEC
jgi:hypothetical protein